MSRVTVVVCCLTLPLGAALSFAAADEAGPKEAGPKETGQKSTPNEASSARWIWTTPEAVNNAPKETVYFRREITLSVPPKRADVVATVDNHLRLYVNGTEAIRSDTWETPIKADLAPLMRSGENTLAVVAINSAPSPAGFLLIGTVRTEDGQTIDISTGKSWRASPKEERDWKVATFSGNGFTPAAELTGVAGGPWAIAGKLDNAKDGPTFRNGAYWKQWRTRQRKSLEKVERPFEPRKPAKLSIIDRFMTATWKRRGQTPSPVCDDRAFLRRVSLDINGLLPSVETITAFVADTRPDKRARFIDTLLADNVAYAEHWMSFWNDLLRNDEQTSIDGLRKPITAWLYKALRDNLPYDVFVANLLDPDDGGPEGYLRGVQWRGTVSASQIPPIQAAQNVGQVLMATQVKCASCHDSFIDEWTLDDAYGLASFFSEKNLKLYKCDAATDKVIAPKFLFPELGSISADADLATRHRRVSELVTAPANPRFAKTIVNRIWHRLNGWGLFEPVDTFDDGGDHGPLLAWLADDFMRNDYDLKDLIRRIALSRTYQSASVPIASEDNADTPTKVAGPPLRRLTAEQILDGIATVTGYWPKQPTMNAPVENDRIRAWRHKIPSSLARALGRPNREQAITVRDNEPTVLRALELVNGRVFANHLRKATEVLLKSSLGQEPDNAKVVNILVERATGRKADKNKLAMLRPLIGTPTDDAAYRQAGWEDALWIVFMSPDFQFIR